MVNNYMASFVICVALLTIILAPFIIKYLYKSFKTFVHLPKIIISLSNHIIEMFINISLPLIIKNILYGLVAMIAMSVIFHFAFLTLDIYPGIIKTIIYVSLVRLFMVYHILPGNLGIQELGLGYLTELTGLGMGVGISVSIIIRLNAYLTLGMLSIIFLLISKDNLNLLNKKYY